MERQPCDGGCRAFRKGVPDIGVICRERCYISVPPGNLRMAEPKPRSIFAIPTDEATEARLDAEAEADYAAGRVVPHAEVVKWLQSWGKPDELPCPTPKPR